MEVSLNRKSAAATTAAIGMLVLATGCMDAPGPKVQVVMGSYGYAGNRKDVKDDLVRLCDGKSSCNFVVKNETFTAHQPPDPSPGEDKSVIFSWKCGDETRKSSAAEGRQATLNCK
jgi:hypothetical protein